MIVCWAAAALAAPDVTVTWKGPHATVSVVPSPGEEVAAEAPVDIALRWGSRTLDFAGVGADLPLARDGLPGHRVEAELTVSVCTKATGVCQPTTWAVAGEVPGVRKGGVTLTPIDRPAVVSSTYQTDADQIAAAAYARAEAEDKRVLLDFGAVWCPPCNLLSAEVLHAEPPPAELERVVVAAVDVDDRRSFALKDRYDVGGYPTLVVTDAQGVELDRLVGYPGREAFLGWLAEAGTLPTDPAVATPAQAAEIALRRVRSGEDASAWIARAEDSVALRLARVQVDPTLDDARWLAAHAPTRAAEWVWGARALAVEPVGRVLLEEALRTSLARSSGAEAADLLWMLAELAHDRALYAAAAATLRTAMTGDPARDRGHVTFLAELLADADDLDGAVAILSDAAARWPGDPTFDLAAAGLLNEAERFAEARVHAERALAQAWDDNKLRAGRAYCRALVGLGRAEEARAAAQTLLAELPAPPAALKVRTHRYRAALAAFVEGE